MSPSGPRVFSDERGYFYESFNAKAFRDATGDALHAVLCAAGFNLRWLMRAVRAGRISAFLRALRLSLADGFTAIKAMVAVLLSSIGTAVGLAAPDRAVQPIPNSA